jgi:hypothetical protein
MNQPGRIPLESINATGKQMYYGYSGERPKTPEPGGYELLENRWSTMLGKSVE